MWLRRKIAGLLAWVGKVTLLFTCVVAGMTGVAAAMEEAIAEAPEQWWSTFAPIWPDLDPEARQGSGRLEPEAARIEPEAGR